MSILNALRAGIREYRRERTLSGWDLGETYVFPEQVTPERFRMVEMLTGLRVVDMPTLRTFPSGSLWRVTLDKDGNGNFLAGVATCISDDRIRDVVCLEVPTC